MGRKHEFDGTWFHIKMVTEHEAQQSVCLDESPTIRVSHEARSASPFVVAQPVLHVRRRRPPLTGSAFR